MNVSVSFNTKGLLACLKWSRCNSWHMTNGSLHANCRLNKMMVDGSALLILNE